jgi:hypothetical protein
MAFNGSGTFTRDNGTHTGSTVWAQDNAAGTKIVDTIHDLHDQDIADGLTNCLTKDGQTTPTANLPMGNFKHTGVASGTARTHYASIGQLQDQGIFWGGTTGGSATAYTISLSPAISAYAQGQQFRFIAHAANTGTATLAVNGLTAYQINRNSSTVAAATGEISSGEIITVVYDTTGGSHFRILSQTPGNLIPLADNTYAIGVTGRAWQEVVTPVIRTRSARTLLFETTAQPICGQLKPRQATWRSSLAVGQWLYRTITQLSLTAWRHPFLRLGQQRQTPPSSPKR